jgi:hypothetical protein
MKKYNNCINMGQYPKWVGKLIVWALKNRLPKGVKLHLYGRGKCSAKGRYNYGSYPLRFYPRCAVYIYFMDKNISSAYESRSKAWNENFELKKELKLLKGDGI